MAKFVKGTSGNPNGRPSLSNEDKKLLKKTSSKSIERMAAIVNDDDAFGAEGWLDGKTQLALLNSSIDRIAGRAATLDVQHSHNGVVKLDPSKQLQALADRLPERIAQQADVIDAEIVEE